MADSGVVILDEGCAHFEQVVAEFSVVRVFRRTGGYRIAAGEAADQLREFVAAEGLVGRAVYVAPSFGAFAGLLAANRYSGIFAGLLLLDPSHPRQSADALRVLATAPATPNAQRLMELLRGFGPDWDQSCVEVAAVRNIGDVPISVLAGGRFDLSSDLPVELQRQLIGDRHRALAEYITLGSDGGTFVVLPEAGHDVAADAPTEVVSSIRALLRQVATRA